MCRKKDPLIIRIMEFLNKQEMRVALTKDLKSEFNFDENAEARELITFPKLFYAQEYGGVDKIQLKTEGFFKLLEYKELKEARQSSRRAQCTAIIAIIIGIIVGAWQIILTYLPPTK